MFRVREKVIIDRFEVLLATFGEKPREEARIETKKDYAYCHNRIIAHSLLAAGSSACSSSSKHYLVFCGRIHGRRF